MSYSDFIRRIQEFQVECRNDVQLACPAEQIEFLKGRLREELGCELPGDYEEFLVLSNGLEWNGMVLFSAGLELTLGHGHFKVIEDVVYVNTVFREIEEFKKMLILGESGMDLYVHYVDDSHSAIIDRWGLHEYETFPSVRELVVSVLRNSLAIFD